jgi:hypothetical protein
MGPRGRESTGHGGCAFRERAALTIDWRKTMIRDPVCGKRINRNKAHTVVEYEKEKYFLCCPRSPGSTGFCQSIRELLRICGPHRADGEEHQFFPVGFNGKIKKEVKDTTALGS